MQLLLQLPDADPQELGVVAVDIIRLDQLHGLEQPTLLEPRPQRHGGDPQFLGGLLLTVPLLADQLAGLVLKLDRMMLPCHNRGSFAGIMPAGRRAHQSWGRSKSNYSLRSLRLG